MASQIKITTDELSNLLEEFIGAYQIFEWQAKQVSSILDQVNQSWEGLSQERLAFTEVRYRELAEEIVSCANTYSDGVVFMIKRFSQMEQEMGELFGRTKYHE